MKKKIVILGATGSIGKSSLAITSSLPDLFEVTGLSANSNENLLLEAGISCGCNRMCLTGRTPVSEKISYTGIDGLRNMIADSQADIVINGISGSAGLLPSVITLENGIDLALANKETVVMAYPLIKALALKNHCRILPVDSEHSAIFTLINHYGKENLDSIVITASGGPFRNHTRQQLQMVTLEDALKHPTWNMGPKITVDSSTLANKGLEVIEACRLFDMTPDHVHVTVHPQSLVHSLIQTKDGVLYAQISRPDMKHPILQALSWPDFTENSLEKLNLHKFDFNSPLEMTFCSADTSRFPMLRHAYDAAEKGASYTIAFNAVNEIAVESFMKAELGFYGISDLTAKVLDLDWSHSPVDFEEVFLIDKEIRLKALEYLK